MPHVSTAGDGSWAIWDRLLEAHSAARRLPLGVALLPPMQQALSSAAALRHQVSMAHAPPMQA
jgi:hypothetical protein